MKRIELIIGHKCNTPCRFCASGKNVSGALSPEAATGLMREYRNAGATGIIFGGGEPSIHEEFLSLVKTAKDIGFSEIEIKTNGVRFCYPEFAETCISAGADSFSVSLWGHDPATHEWMAGRPGAFEMTEMAIKHLLHYGAGVKIDFLLSAVTCGREMETLERFARIGVKRIDMWLFSMFGAGGSGREMVPSMTDAGFAIVRTAEAAARHGCGVMTSHVPPCCMKGRAELYFNVSRYELIIVMPGGHSFKAEDSPFEAGRHVPVCGKCCFSNLCPGPRIEYMEEFGDAEFHPIRSGEGG